MSNDVFDVDRIMVEKIAKQQREEQLKQEQLKKEKLVLSKIQDDMNALRAFPEAARALGISPQKYVLETKLWEKKKKLFGKDTVEKKMVKFERTGWLIVDASYNPTRREATRTLWLTEDGFCHCIAWSSGEYDSAKLLTIEQCANKWYTYRPSGYFIPSLKAFCLEVLSDEPVSSSSISVAQDIIGWIIKEWSAKRVEDFENPI